MSEEIKRDCSGYVYYLFFISRTIGEAKARNWLGEVFPEHDLLNTAVEYFNEELKEIVPRHIIERFEKAAENKDYEEMIAALEDAALYVAMFCRGRLKAQT